MAVIDRLSHRLILGDRYYHTIISILSPHIDVQNQVRFKLVNEPEIIETKRK